MWNYPEFIRYAIDNLFFLDAKILLIPRKYKGSTLCVWRIEPKKGQMISLNKYFIQIENVSKVRNEGIAFACV